MLRATRENLRVSQRILAVNVFLQAIKSPHKAGVLSIFIIVIV